MLNAFENHLNMQVVRSGNGISNIIQNAPSDIYICVEVTLFIYLFQYIYR